MKKTLLYIILLFIIAPVIMTNEASAQTHLEFKGVPIDGNIDIFVKKMEAKGLRKLKEEDGVIIMSGPFAGKDEAEIYVVCTPKTKTVWKVGVSISGYSSWREIKGDYNQFVELLRVKYGEPTDDFRFFESPFYEGDGYELSALKSDKCTYLTLFADAVWIEMRPDVTLTIHYGDPINSKLNEDEQSILKDI